MIKLVRFVMFMMFILASITVLSPTARISSAQSPIKILVAGTTGPGDPRSIDPQHAIDTRDWTLENLLFPALTTLDEESNEVVGGLAKGWDISDDGLTYTFHLVENVPWVRYNADTKAVEQVKDNDGNVRIVTAQDVVYGWTRALDPATASPAAYMLAPLIAGGEKFNAGKGSAKDVGLRAVDKFTF
jgi:ABC-type oligopeptide transport system substrate-binding subunit